MAVIKPFQGYRFNAQKIRDIQEVLVPPYDVISQQAKKSYRKVNAHNMIHLTLAKAGKGKFPYHHVQKRLTHWISKKILSQENSESIYFYTMEYQVKPDISMDIKISRKKNLLSGFISLVRLEEFKEGVILPHEITFPNPRNDRYHLIESCQAHLEPIYAIYSDQQKIINRLLLKKVDSSKPLYQVTDRNGTIHRFWKITEIEIIEKIKKIISKKRLLIADGHHRYEAALQYRNKTVKKEDIHHPANFIMMYLVNMDDPGLSVFPTHRMIRNVSEKEYHQFYTKVKKYFDLIPIQGKFDSLSQNKIREKLSSRGSKGYIFGLYDGKYYLLKNKKKSNYIDSELFQKIIVKGSLSIPEQKDMDLHIGYTHSITEAVDKVKSGEYQFSFFLRSPSLHLIEKICSKNIRLPQKTTYFFPKPLSGFVLYVFVK